MTTITHDGQIHENAADHAAAAVHALAHMATSAHFNPSGEKIAAATKIVGHVAEHGIIDTADGLTVQLEPAEYVAEQVVDAPVVELPEQAREFLTKAMLGEDIVTIAHAGGSDEGTDARFRVVSIAPYHAKVRQLRDNAGLAPARALHYTAVNIASNGYLETDADLTPATVNGFHEYRDADRALASELATTLGNLERIHRHTDGHDIVTAGTRQRIDSTVATIRAALRDMRKAAPAPEPEPEPEPEFKHGDRVNNRYFGDGTVDGLRSMGRNTIHVKFDDGHQDWFMPEGLTRIDDEPKPDSLGPFTTGGRVYYHGIGFGTVTIDHSRDPFPIRVTFESGRDDGFLPSTPVSRLVPLRPVREGELLKQGQDVYVTSNNSTYSHDATPGRFTVLRGVPDVDCDYALDAEPAYFRAEHLAVPVEQPEPARPF